nr:hypothetical protein [Streptacidiphilus fuscans]
MLQLGHDQQLATQVEQVGQQGDDEQDADPALLGLGGDIRTFVRTFVRVLIRAFRRRRLGLDGCGNVGLGVLVTVGTDDALRVTVIQ